MTVLLLIGLAGIIFLLVQLIVLRVHPFLALLLTGIAVALAAGIPVGDLTKVVEDGFGTALGHIGLVIALGAMIGRIVEESGGSEVLANAMIARFGDRRISLALTIVGFLIGIPVFFDVGVIMLIPIAYGVARRMPGRLVAIALPMCATLLCVHALLPPHPGALASALLLQADIGRVLLFGLPVAIATIVVLQPLWAWLARGDWAMSEDVSALLGPPAASDTVSRETIAPPFRTIFLIIITPVVLILAGTVAPAVLPATSPVLPVFAFFGIPFVALLIDVLLCGWILGIRRGWTADRVAHVVGAAIPAVAMVIMITGGGAIFAKVLVTTGIGGAAADLLRATGLPLLLLAFVLTTLIRAIQGPTTVALMTAGGIIAPFAASGGLDANHIALLCLAMGAGGMAASHVNDPGFWLVTRLLGLSVRDGLRTWTIATTLGGITAFAIVSVLWMLV